MSTCKDCIHFEVCEAVWTSFGISKVVPSQCRCFKDRSKIVELPCAVGDTVYYISQYNTISLECGKIYEAVVVRFATTNVGTTIVIQIHSKGVTEIPNIEDFGKVLFKTKEEAEQALRERE